MDERHRQTNRDTWDRRTREHVRSKFYDVEGFLAGACTLGEVELGELGDVRGKDILHLQCHFGLDTLSLARRGAHVTGVDLSPEAITQAQELAVKAGLQARFFAADVHDTAHYLDRTFDVVFTSYGVLEWLPDMRAWAQVVAAALKPGGCLHLVEFHPYSYALQGDPYFHSPEPTLIHERSYTENAEEVAPIYVWSHPTSDVLNALIGAELTLEHFREFPFSPYDCFPGLVETEPRRFVWADAKVDVPMLYSVKARKR